MTQQNRSTTQAKDPGKDQSKDKDLARDKDKQSTTKSASQIEAEIGETRSAITTDIRELNDKFSSANVKEAAKDVMGGVKDAAVEQAAEIKNAVVDKAIEVKDVVVDKAIEVKDVVVDKAVEVKDVATEKLVEAKDAVVDTMETVGAQAKRVGSASWDFTKANAVPLALVGAGVAWMVANKRSGSSTRRLPPARMYRAEREDYAWTEEDDELISPAPYERSPRSAQALAGDGARKRSGNATKPAATATARVGTRARELKHEAADRLERAEHAIADSASHGVDYVQEKARRAGAATQQFASANPILVALAAIAAGVGVGMLLPATAPEDRLLAPAREKFQRLVGDVKEAASDAASVVKDTANESMNTLV